MLRVWFVTGDIAPAVVDEDFNADSWEWDAQDWFSALLTLKRDGKVVAQFLRQRVAGVARLEEE